MNLADAMGRLGFTKYESLAYAALLRLAPMTGYELGKRSGVPLSKSYVTLQRLVEKGAAVVEQTDPPRYAPVAPETVAGSCRASFMADIDALLQATVTESADREGSHIWCVMGRTNILSLAGELIRESQRSVHIDADAVDLQALGPALDEVRGRGRVHVLRAAPEATPTARIGTIVLLLDDRRILAGTTEPDDECRAACTRNLGLVSMGLSYCQNIDVAAAPSDLSTTPRIMHENWLAWEDRKHRDLVGRLN